MTAYLRVIKTNRWQRDPAWMTPEDLPPTALKDVGDSRLSVYEVDTEDAEHLAAIAFFVRNSSEFNHIQYALIDPDILGPLDIEVEVTPGDTPSTVANGLHREFWNLTARKASDLAHVMGEQTRFKTIFKKDVESKTSDLCRAGEINCDNLREKLRLRIPECVQNGFVR